MVFLMNQEHSCRRLITHAENILGNFYVLGEERKTSGEWSGLGKRKHPGKQEKEGSQWWVEWLGEAEVPRKVGKRRKPVVGGVAWGSGSTPESRKKKEASGEWSGLGKRKYPGK